MISLPIRMFNRIRSGLRNEDLHKVLGQKENILKRVMKSETLRKSMDDVKLFVSMLGDYVKGEYKQVPVQTILAVAGALLYILNPFDVVPDFLLGLGLLDDATVLRYCLKLVGKDLDKYREWKRSDNERTRESSMVNSP